MSTASAAQPRPSHADLLKLKRWNTPTIYNGWEQITKLDRTRDGINLEETRDFMPQMGPMVGYAATVVIEPSEPKHRESNPGAWLEYYRWLSGQEGPKIVVVQDLDKPAVIGSMWGEVNANTHRALGCVGAIVDGAVRDIDEMTNAGFKAIARRLCVGHAYVIPIRWGVEVEVFGQKIQNGQLIHADKHGFLAVEREAEGRLLEAAVFMDNNECQTVIAAARGAAMMGRQEILEKIGAAGQAFRETAMKKFKSAGEW